MGMHFMQRPCGRCGGPIRTNEGRWRGEVSGFVHDDEWHCEQFESISTLTRERDEARAKLAELEHTAGLTRVKCPTCRCMLVFGDPCRCCAEPDVPELNPLVDFIAAMPADEAKTIDELTSLDIAHEEAAASERAAIVAMLERVARQYDDLHGNDEANALYAIAEEIIRLDHHREPGKERGE